ncbi:hypothetical protein AYP76_07480 [Ligilactobacillus agilis]|uniref:Phage tail tape measure protein domain-containing protein n=1 Tax=Ligilactobacillus agilis TaxID=1601 RepID=A0A231Q3R0_9LACO|nr:hypothetical protein [Ligilactobacillus agilis]OXC07234.1 hypothetical protein AYP74_08550 [Ligilactobacillus agilis]OXC07578.1 hypothetical protein AYP76_07480 [Ligilactobacillus agilis]OXC11023.1 hypothetical protein AYP75_04985 [Ligilactobacillus agilis]OXS40504.1 hypothetical protein AYP70_04320 [Ligilactobacillus agilis]OXS41055.1 hypothetical protein AYP69_03550 [Ligilactobacillus agilis]
MANETTISAKIQVSGLAELEKAKSLLESLNRPAVSSTGLTGLANSLREVAENAKKAEKSLKGLSDLKFNNATIKLSGGLVKATEQATKLEARLKTVADINGEKAGLKLSEGLAKATATSNKIRESILRSNQAEQELASSAQKVASAEKEAASAAQQGAKARKSALEASRNANRQAQQAQQQTTFQTAQKEKEPGKFRSAVREAFGMYTLGQLGANAVMAAGAGVGNLARSGLDYISEQQASAVSWASNARSVNKLLGKNISNREANAFSKGMVKDVSNLATEAGNDYKQVSDAALAFYATGAGVSTAGNKKKTLQLTRDMLNLQDSGGLNDEEMGRFIQSVAKTLDQDKLTSERLQQLKQFNPNIDNYLQKAYKKRTGKEGGIKDFSGDDLVTALHMMGLAPGVSDASKKMNQSLQGVRRSVKNGLVRMTGQFETELGKNLNKAFGGDGKLFSRITGWFNNSKKTDAFVGGVANKTAGVITTAGKVGREAYDFVKDGYSLVKPYLQTYGKSFVQEMKSIGKGIGEAYQTVKGWGKKFISLIPKSTQGKIENIGQTLSSMAGKATAFLVAARGLSKIPIVGKGVESAIKPLLSLTSKIPVVGKGLTGIISKITGIKPQREMSAANTMQSAANTMMSAANKFNGSGNGTGTGGFTPGGKGKKPFTGKGAFSNEFNPYVADSYVPGTTTRMGRYHNGKTILPPSRFGQMVDRGNELLTYGQETRVGRNANFIKRNWTKLKGNSLVKIGTLGDRVLNSKVGLGALAIGRGASYVGRGIGAGTRVIGKYGMPGMNALFTGIDVMSVLGSTKAGSLARHQGVGNAVGSGVGSTLGMAAGGALGSLLGPVGTAVGSTVGGMAGGFLGGKLGSWFGGKFGGSKGGKPKQTWSQKQESKAQAQYEKDNFTSSYNDLYKNANQQPQTSAKAAYRTLNAATKSNAKARTAAMHYQDAMAAGDIAGMVKYQQQMQKQVKKQDTKNIATASKKVNSAKSKAEKAYSKAYEQARKSLDTNPAFAGLSKKQKDRSAKAIAKNDKNYKEAEKAASNAIKNRKKAIAKYEKETGEKYKSAKTGSNKKSASKKQSSSKKNTSGANSTASRKHGSSSKSSSNKKHSSKAPKKQNASSSGKKRSTNNSSKKKATSSYSKSKAQGSASVAKDAKQIAKMSKDMKKLKNKKVKVSVSVSGAKKISKLSKNMKKLKTKKAKVSVSISGANKVKKLTSSIKKLKNKRVRVRATASGSGKVKSLSTSIKRIKGKHVKVSARVSGTSKVRSLKSAIAKVKAKSVNVAAKVSGTGKVKDLRSAINSLKGKHVSVSAKVSGTGAVRSLASAIAAVKNKHVTISATVHKQGKLATGTPGASQSFNAPALATGTPAATTNQWAANGGAKKGVYLVNDAPGADYVEAFKTREGLVGLFPKQRNLLVPLEEGTQVLNAKETKKKFPRLEKGTKKFEAVNLKLPKFPKLATGTPGSKGVFTNSKNTSVTNNFSINVTVNADSGSSNTSQTSLANTIANTIAEKLRQQFPLTEI